MSEIVRNPMPFSPNFWRFRSIDFSKLPDGSVADPFDKCSPLYYTCAGGQTYEKLPDKPRLWPVDERVRLPGEGQRLRRPARTAASTNHINIDISKQLDLEISKGGNDGQQSIALTSRSTLLSTWEAENSLYPRKSRSGIRCENRF